MKNKDILKQVIEKVRKNGFKKYQSYFADDWNDDDIRMLVTDIGFAKALWGKGKHNVECRPTNHFYCNKCKADMYYWMKQTKYCWEYHLQKIVLRKDKLKYIEKFL